MGPFVYFQVFAPRENFATAGKGAREGFLAGVHPDVIN